ncbi:M20 family metallopeptidase [Streptomyces sp. TLI_146]|uniref:M20 metallopeptidase family protein n=1 Tax=Streptomyces sp. TLI_146 TaxID=1938858 RepID=UPI000C714FFC|nr:M20 family metallopeptidase [Streptomyces sp. TLI_146]PKV90102.1 hippurate hydrolase [Streptomyces sp. TLI_146]
MFTHADALPLADDLTELRRDLHREPELGLHLPRTQHKVLDALAGLPLEIATGERISSVTAVLRGGRPGPAILLRADMDALPITEDTGLPYASAVPGVMHACGHDLHTAGLVGAARLLAARREALAGDVVLMFQPGEEVDGGAGIMIEEGVLDAAGRRVSAAYALHVFSTQLPSGMAATRAGTFLAASDAFDVVVTGRGGHGSTPHLTRDPLVAACEMVTALQTRIAREIDVNDPAVVTVGSLHAGEARNVVPGHAEFQATVRTYSEAGRIAVQALVERTLNGIALALGVEVDLTYRRQYPPTVNPVEEAAFALETARELFGPHAVVEVPTPLSGSEDFSFVLEHVPGAFVAVGACPPGSDPATAPVNHSAQAVFDDAVLPAQAALLARLATGAMERYAEPGPVAATPVREHLTGSAT